MWNGNAIQAQSFVTNTGISYPLLRTAGSVGSQYATGWDFVFIVDPGGTIAFRNLSAFVPGQVGVEIDQLLEATAVGPTPPTTFQVAEPWPNPFNPRTSVRFQLYGDGQAQVQVQIFDLRGRQIASLWQRRLTRGQEYVLPWDGRDGSGTPLPSGVYQMSISVDGLRQSRPVTLVK